jgi:hypothetical protein
LETYQRIKVGIDVGRSRVDFAILHPDGHPLEMHSSFSNSPVGVEKAKQLLIKTIQKHGFLGVDIAAEATGLFWLLIFMQLQQDAELACYAPRLTILNATWVKWYKRSFPPDHKSDQIDPYYIADHLRTLVNPIWWTYDPHWLNLRFHTRLRFHLSQSLIREKNHYHLYLFLAYSAYSQKKTRPFNDIFSHINEVLLHSPGLLENLQDLDVDDLAIQLHELSRHRLNNPMKSAKQLKLALQESFLPPKELEPAIQSALDSLITVIRHLKAQIKIVEKKIADLVENDYPEVAWLRSIPGIGPVFASGIAAEIGDLHRFSHRLRWDKKKNCYRRRSTREVEDAVAKFAGLCWPENASGDFSAEETPLSKRGNAYLRYFILQAADRMRLFIPSYSAYYSKKYIQATKHHHKRALVLTGRKAVGLIVGLLHHHEFYRPEEVSPQT